MGLGGNPYGPAGTGKTESVKALGGLFGRQVLVFNCDEVSDFSAFLSLCGFLKFYPFSPPQTRELEFAKLGISC